MHIVLKMIIICNAEQKFALLCANILKYIHVNTFYIRLITIKHSMVDPIEMVV